MGRRLTQRRPPPRARINMSRTRSLRLGVRASAPAQPAIAACYAHQARGVSCAPGLRGPCPAVLLCHKTPRGRAARQLRVLQHARHTMAPPGEVLHGGNEQPVNKMWALFARALPSKILRASCVMALGSQYTEAEQVNLQLRQSSPRREMGGVAERSTPAKNLLCCNVPAEITRTSERGNTSQNLPKN